MHADSSSDDTRSPVSLDGFTDMLISGGVECRLLLVIVVVRVQLIATLPFALARRTFRPRAHWGPQYQVGAAIFLSASEAWEKTRSHREHDNG